MSNKYLSEFVTYCIVGVFLTGFLLVFQFFLNDYIPYFFANLVVYFVGISLGFFAHSSFSFRGRSGKFGSFFMVSIILSIMSLSLAQFLRFFVGLDQFFYFYGMSPSFLVSLLFYATIGFVVNRSYVFSSR